MMTSLDLGDKFDTSNVTDMYSMFYNCLALTTLDLGPAFVKIPDGTVLYETSEVGAHEDMFVNCGTTDLTIYAPESIYKNRTAFKLSSTDTTATISAGNGTINPIYRPQWEKVSSSLDDATNPTKLIVNLKGTAAHTETLDGGKVKINYSSDVTSALTAEDITVYVNGVPAPYITKQLPAADPATGATVTQTLTLSGFEELARQSGVPFKEWSGNIQIKIGGRGQDTSTYEANTLVDDYGNQSMSEIDSTGTWIDVLYKDADSTTNVNTSGTMFIDTIKPEFTYEYANTTIGDGNHGDTKIVTIVFDVIDKYFKQVTISAENITVKVADSEVNNTVNVSKVLTKIDDVEYTVNGVANTKIGERYQLVITGLDKGDGSTYSGPMTLAFPNNLVEDKSGNKNLATTITIGVDETDGNPNTNTEPHPDGVVVDVVDPVWTVDGTPTITTTTVGGQPQTTATIKLNATDKYFANSALSKELIQIFVEQANVANIETEIQTNLTGPTNITDGHQYEYTISNIEEAYDTFMEQVEEYLAGTGGRPYREVSGPITLKIPEGTATESGGVRTLVSGIIDQSGNLNEEFTFELGTIDTLKPEIIKLSAENNPSLKTQTITFMITDKYIDTTDALETGEIIVKVNGETASSINKEDLTIIETLKADVNGDGTVGDDEIVGYKYQLVLKQFEQGEKQEGKDFIEWSGNVTIDIVEGAVKDTNGRTNALTTIDGKFADFIQPKIEIVSASNNTSAKKQTIVFKATDKYLDTTNPLEEGEITVKVNGEIASSITKQIISRPEIKATVNGVPNTVVGYTYTLELSTFEQGEKQDGKDFIEWSGNVTIEVAEGAVTDKGPNGDNTNANKNVLTPLTGVFADFITPKVEQQGTATNNTSAKTQTIIFTATDKYLDTANVLTADEITVYVDEELTTSIAKPTTPEEQASNKDKIWKELTSSPIKATVNGVENTVVGYTYTLVLSNFEKPKTSINRDREYTDWSGTVSIEIAEGAVTDKGPNGDSTNVNKNAEKTISGIFADYVNPDVTYQYYGTTRDETPGPNPDINYDDNGDTVDERAFKMEIDVTDKYYTEGQKLTLDDFAIQISSGDVDGSGNIITYNLNEIPDVTIDFDSTQAITATGIKKTTNTANGTVETVTTTIGYRYVITISNLEQLKRAISSDTLDYSGVITVALTADKVTDTSNNGNHGTTITSGINLAGSEQVGGSSQVVDLVNPIWEKYSAVVDLDANPVSAVITVRGTDTYFDTVDFSEDDITMLTVSTIIDNGEKKQQETDVTSQVSIDIDETANSPLTRTRRINGVDTTIEYGVEYQITLTGFPIDAGQLKLRIDKDTLTDEYGNKNKVTDMRVYNTLTSAEDSSGNYESLVTSLFLSNPYNIQRQNIESITFKSDLTDLDEAKSWDVSDAQDDSILAWYTGSGPYQVFIGSDEPIFANIDSSYLFSYIGYASNCTASSTINSLGILNTNNVTNMSYMFNYCGYRAMTGLDLGSNFKTHRVTDMNNMFNSCGSTLMNTFSLGSNFNTAKVEDMSSMFQSIGAEKLQALSLGNNFYTNEVKYMNNMFNGTGASEMTTFSLGNHFNTAKVENMSGMFQGFGQAKMVSLDLGDQFYVTLVTNMDNMFNGCGSTEMIRLDLGPAFTKIATQHSNFMTNCGKSNLVIYAPEAIYKDKTSFK